MLLTFIPIAAVVTATPGATTAMVLRSAMSGGWRSGIKVIIGNEIGVAVWALLSTAGVSALIAASEAAFVALKVTGAGVLIWLGLQSLRNSRQAAHDDTAPTRRSHHPLRDGVVTSLANPKLAVFFVALFPQFVGRRDTVLGTTLLMAGLIIVFDFVWYSTLSVLVSRARRAFDRTRLARWLERVTGSVLIGLGIRVAVETR
jgi:threonine/homoserine/homoserine lactone efflux protein